MPADRCPQQQQQQQQQQDTSDAALGLVFATCTLLQRDVAALLCTSSGTAQLIAASMRGVAVRADTAPLPRSLALQRWLTNNAALVGSLEVKNCSQTALLETHGAVCAALPSLTGLRSLHMAWAQLPLQSRRQAGDHLAASVSALTQLTQLDTPSIAADGAAMARLPRSLVELRVHPADQERLQLGHLTACTMLDLMVTEETELQPPRQEGGSSSPGGSDSTGDVLPPNLQALRGNLVGVGVLARLPRLVCLHGPHSAERLVEFARTSPLGQQLTEVSLMLYGDRSEWAQMQAAEEAGLDGTFGLRRAVAALQTAGIAGVVRSVVLDSIGGDSDISLAPAVLTELQRLPALDSLRLVVIPVDPAHLLGLTQLSEIDLLNVHFNDSELCALPGMLARLPKLRKVVMSRPTAAAAAHALQASLAGLTGLRVELMGWP